MITSSNEQTGQIISDLVQWDKSNIPSIHQQNQSIRYLSLPSMLKSIFIFPIRVYQVAISPWLPNACRHQPTCSQYAIEAIREWGVFKGMWLGMKRISKCHPWGTSGYDPVPHKHTH